MAPSTSDSGRMEKEMEWEDRYGKMEPSTKATGLMTWLMDKEDSSKLEETSIRENGLMIKPKEKEFTSIRMVLHTLENGTTINNMAMDMKNGLMELNMKGIIFLINNKGYVIEDAIHKGEYNKFKNWDYSSFFESLGGKNIETITSVKKLSDCLYKAYSKRDLYFFNCIISNDDVQKNLIKWGKSVGKFNKS